MRKNLLWSAMIVMGTLELSAQQPLTYIDNSITVGRVRVGTGGTSFLANDFHMRFRADHQDFSNPVVPTWAPMVVNDLDPAGYYFNCGGIGTPTSFSVTQNGEWIDLYWTFADTWVNSSQWNSFGFTNRGGVRFKEAQWWWTYDGVDVNDLPDNWQDWYKDPLTGELVDAIRNRGTLPISVERTIGSLSATVNIADIGTMIYPPDPVTPDPGPVVLPGNGGVIDYRWPWPGNDPSYYMFYETQTGGDDIWFTNAANVMTIPEPSSLLLLGLAPAFCWLRRRR